MPPTVSALLAAAVEALGGAPRAGQEAMAQAVQRALMTGEHLLVQAGTGTGKSLAYLIPALLAEQRVVVATATLALQAQLVERDLPALTEAIAPMIGRRPSFAILKGRRNYLCLHRLHDGAPPDDPEALFAAAPTSVLGQEIIRVRAWAQGTRTGEREELAPGVSERAWSQLAVSGAECLGAQKCPYGSLCWAEQARDRAARSDLVVTNHALLAIDAIERRGLLPEHGAVVVDEAHELVDRTTSAATSSLSAPIIERATRRARGRVEGDVSERLAAAGAALAAELDGLAPARLISLSASLAATLTLVRDAARSAVSAAKGAQQDPVAESARRQLLDAVGEVHDCAVRLLESSEHDVAWIATTERGGSVLQVAPLSVSGLLRERLFAQRTVVLTSATLRLGGSFDAIARSVGLPVPATTEQPWTGLDVGSPFDYARQGILYVARHLPRPGRDGLPGEYLEELATLVTAAGGRTLGLFSSRRAALTAAEVLRGQLDVPLLVQGEDTTAALVRRFAADPATCLFGTMSFWQGVDVPGPALQLVVIDRIPFPRPDDPLHSARVAAAEAAGGNGFLAVSVTAAALRLAQGAGRLIRSLDDRGVVAVLDPRLADAGYAGFLRRSLPPFWATTDSALVRSSLAAIDRVTSSLLPGARSTTES